MYQTLIHFNPASSHARKLMDQPYQIHYMLEHINTSRQRILWRLNQDRLLVRHINPLDWTELDRTHPNLGDRSHTRINPLYPVGSEHLFNLFAFIGQKSENNHWHVQQPQQYIQWLAGRAKHTGFELLEIEAFKATDYFVRTRSAPLKLQPAKLVGTLQVIDPSVFQNILQNGIGRMRAYGCGMMLLQPLE
jgi:hypothetical protein